MPAALLANVLADWGLPFGGWGCYGFGCCGVILNLAICFFVMVDADRRDQPGCLWAIVVFFTTIIGLLVYLVVIAFSDIRRQ